MKLDIPAQPSPTSETWELSAAVSPSTEEDAYDRATLGALPPSVFGTVIG
jgi:hypothetical protein